VDLLVRNAGLAPNEKSPLFPGRGKFSVSQREEQLFVGFPGEEACAGGAGGGPNGRRGRRRRRGRIWRSRGQAKSTLRRPVAGAQVACAGRAQYSINASLLLIGGGCTVIWALFCPRRPASIIWCGGDIRGTISVRPAPFTLSSSDLIE